MFATPTFLPRFSISSFGTAGLVQHRASKEQCPGVTRIGEPAVWESRRGREVWKPLPMSKVPGDIPSSRGATCWTRGGVSILVELTGLKCCCAGAQFGRVNSPLSLKINPPGFSVLLPPPPMSLLHLSILPSAQTHLLLSPALAAQARLE